MRRWIVGSSLVWLAACPGGDVVGGGTTDATDGTTGGSMSTSTSSSASGSSTASGSNTDSGTTDPTTGTTEGASESTSPDGSTADTGTTMAIAETSSTTEIDPSATTIVTATSEDTGSLLGNGEACDADDQCASGFCYLAGILGGICGECLDDDDCFYGCGLPNPLAVPATGSTCDDGGIGAGCESSEACQMTLVCTEVLALPGVLTMNGCSECDSDDDCPELCSPDYSTALTEFEGHWECVDAGSQPLGASCDYEGSGNAACTSGHCAPADIQGLLLLGVCSQCIDDVDCAGGTCEAPTIDLDGTMTAGMCV